MYAVGCCHHGSVCSPVEGVGDSVTDGVSPSGRGVGVGVFIAPSPGWSPEGVSVVVGAPAVGVKLIVPPRLDVVVSDVGLGDVVAVGQELGLVWG